MEKTVLCIYDIRSIQRFIFSGGNDEDRIGAGNLVAEILPEGLTEALKQCGLTENEYRMDYLSDAEAFAFFEDPGVLAQIVSSGAGSAIMMYRSEALCHRVNRKLSRYVLEHSYGLQVDIGMIEKTDSFREDISHLYWEAERMRSHAFSARPLGVLPVAMAEEGTGNPLSVKDPETGELLSSETMHKRGRIPENLYTPGEEKKIAYIHIDGNDMSLTVNNVMNSTEDYREGIILRRKITARITNTWMRALGQIGESLKVRYGEEVYRHYQLLNVGGDDINLRCSEEIALDVAEAFVREIGREPLWSSNAMGVIPFSVCVGIAVVPSSYSYQQGQGMAFRSCGSAKFEAKKPENRVNGRAVNWIDLWQVKDPAEQNAEDQNAQDTVVYPHRM